MTIHETGSPITASPPPPNSTEKDNHPVTAGDPLPLTQAIQLLNEARVKLGRLRDRHMTLLSQSRGDLRCGPAGLQGNRRWVSIKDVLVAMQAVHAECLALKTTCAELEVLVEIKRLHQEIARVDDGGVS